MNVFQLQRALALELPGATKRDCTDEQRFEAAEYLEKLCSFTWKLPFPSSRERAELLKLWLRDPAGSSQTSTKLPDKLQKDIVQAAIKYDCLPANARKIKALANTIRQMSARAWPIPNQSNELDIPQKDLHKEADALLIAASIDQFHPDLLRFLQTYPDAWVQLVNWNNGKGDLPSYSDLAQVLDGLQRSAAPKKESNKSPTPGSAPMIPVYPDPVHLSIFRIHKLLREATSTERNSVNKLRLSRYLSIN